MSFEGSSLVAHMKALYSQLDLLKEARVDPLKEARAYKLILSHV